MLKRLLKYDLLYMFKCLVIFYALSIFFGILTRIFFNIGDAFIFEIIGKVCSATAITMMANIVFNNILRMWARFYCNLYGDESYLSHTLPVKKSTHYASKALTAIITLTASFIVIALTIVVAYYTEERYDFFVNNFIYKDGNMLDVLLVTGVLLLEIIHVLQLGYTGIILGNRKMNMKIVWSFVYGFIAYIISQLCTLAVILVMALTNEDLKELFFVAKNQMEPMDNTIKGLMYVMFIVLFIYIVVVWLINKRLFDKGVNVE